jgi:hypothetical protein
LCISAPSSIPGHYVGQFREENRSCTRHLITNLPVTNDHQMGLSAAIRSQKSHRLKDASTLLDHRKIIKPPGEDRERLSIPSSPTRITRVRGQGSRQKLRKAAAARYAQSDSRKCQSKGRFSHLVTKNAKFIEQYERERDGQYLSPELFCFIRLMIVSSSSRHFYVHGVVAQFHISSSSSL